MEVINEERQTPADGAERRRLTADNIKALGEKGRDADLDATKSFLDSNGRNVDALNNISINRERATKTSKFSKFEERSCLDQDDSYGNYKPKFQTKSYKVTGRTREVMKLQRMASLDHSHALLGPV